MHDHELSLFQTDDTVWITVGDKILVRVMQTDEGALCDMYDASLIESDGDEAHMSACYAFFSEASDPPDHDETDEDIDYFNDD